MKSNPNKKENKTAQLNSDIRWLWSVVRWKIGWYLPSSNKWYLPTHHNWCICNKHLNNGKKK